MRLPPRLSWLPSLADPLGAIRTARTAERSWDDLVQLARHDLDMLATDRLASLRRARFPDATDAPAGTRPVRLLLLGSSTVSHLAGGIETGALRRGLHATVRTAEYGQLRASAIPPGSDLDLWAPTHVLFSFDARFATGRLRDETDQEAAASHFADLAVGAWREARARFGADLSILQALVLPVLPRLLGSNERRDGRSPSALLDRINPLLGERAEAEGVHLVDPAALSSGRDPLVWYDPVLWHKGKQEISPLASPLWGDLVGRVLGAEQGRSGKCLVLDLDNTLWGGVIGDDGLDGIVLGQGSPDGEAFLAVQDYAAALSRRGIILAVCSKNDEANARLPFERHPDMILRAGDIAAFVANWNDKPSNLRAIAAALSIGLDALVFLDDNPFERNQVRAALPEVVVPEIPDDPALVPAALADGGYFEALAVTADDRARGAQYEANRERRTALESAGDPGSFLAGLGMTLAWHPFRAVDHARIVQLVNKTNQFNLTTRRYNAAEIEALCRDPGIVGLSFRLRDAYGDNGMIAVIIVRLAADGPSAAIDTWLMSCRVLGRGVEAACLDVLVGVLRGRGVTRVVGEYVPSARNAMVRSHYQALGFAPDDAEDTGDTRRSSLSLDDWTGVPHHLAIEPGRDGPEKETA